MALPLPPAESPISGSHLLDVQPCSGIPSLNWLKWTEQQLSSQSFLGCETPHAKQFGSDLASPGRLQRFAPRHLKWFKIKGWLLEAAKKKKIVAKSWIQNQGNYYWMYKKQQNQNPSSISEELGKDGSEDERAAGGEGWEKMEKPGKWLPGWWESESWHSSPKNTLQVYPQPGTDSSEHPKEVTKKGI